MDVALLDGAFVHYVARDAEESHLDIGRRSLLPGDLVHLKGEIPPQDVYTVRLRRVLPRADRAPKLGRDLRDVANADGSVHGSHMEHAAAFQPMQPYVALERSGFREFQDEVDIGPLPFRGLVAANVAELRAGPLLALIFAEVLDDEWAHIRDRK